ncbi:MAG: hypothetical protein AB7V00_06520 [Bacilli bacterium]
MSDLRLFNLKKDQLETKSTIDKLSLQKLMGSHLDRLMGITLIDNDFTLTDTITEKVETFGYDENYRLTIIEYRIGKFSGIVSKGFMFLDYIMNNQGKVKSILSEKLGYDLVKQLNFFPRLIIIGEDFNKYDEYAIKQMPYVVELIKYQLFEKQFLVIEKIYQSKKIYGDDAIKLNELQKQFSDFVLSLGDEVCEERTANFICFRKIKAFAYLYEQEALMLNVLQNGKYKTYKITSQKDLTKVEDLVERSYDEN